MTQDDWRKTMTTQAILENPARVGTRNLIRFNTITAHRHTVVIEELTRRYNRKVANRKHYAKRFCPELLNTPFQFKYRFRKRKK